MCISVDRELSQSSPAAIARTPLSPRRWVLAGMVYLAEISSQTPHSTFFLLTPSTMTGPKGTTTCTHQIQSGTTNETEVAPSSLPAAS